MYYGLEQQDTYVLKEGIVKTSIILRDGREFNISYIKGPDIISLLNEYNGWASPSNTEK